MVGFLIVKAISCYGSYSGVSVDGKYVFDDQDLTLFAIEADNDILI